MNQKVCDDVEPSSTLAVSYNEMCSINLLFTYLLTMLGWVAYTTEISSVLIQL